MLAGNFVLPLQGKGYLVVVFFAIIVDALRAIANRFVSFRGS